MTQNEQKSVNRGEQAFGCNRERFVELLTHKPNYSICPVNETSVLIQEVLHSWQVYYVESVLIAKST